MSDGKEEVMVAAGVWFVLVALFSGGIYLGYQSKGSGLLLECEKPLPRTERCVLAAVPEVRP